MAATLPLPLLDYQRYGRQMILDGFGLSGQVKLSQSSVVVVGAGGLGCPVLQYLAAAGVGNIGIIDDDVVELSNLQRQILHAESSVGIHKAESAADSVKRINTAVRVDVITSRLTSLNALEVLSRYDIILDCTDNAPTRYLLSDVAVILKKPLISGAAQKYEGQLAIYNLGSDGPCYRCLFPKPPAPESAGTCEETGILGAVTGIIGNLQALETIKLITDIKPSMLLFSAISSPPFRSIKLRSRKADCIACGNKDFSLSDIAETDYVQACGGLRPNWVQLGLANGRAGHRATVKELKKALDEGEAINFIDVRPPTEFGICQLQSSRNVSLNELVARPEAYLPDDAEIPTYIVCRLGNDSQIAAKALRSCRPDSSIQDVIGGLRAWSKEIDDNFPIY
ncbi:Adenylyltransferase and sulfurtransferase MOCS3 [Leucoagaricus sp. SymC.cos]|nr:Adenylyltransferase and sulfurtransferase MOCS3 [Leucoagaricus sp. SymC.cos]